MSDSEKRIPKIFLLSYFELVSQIIGETSIWRTLPKRTKENLHTVRKRVLAFEKAITLGKFQI